MPPPPSPGNHSLVAAPKLVESGLSAQILTQVRDGIVVQDMRGRIEWVNPACEHMLGWTLEEMRGRRPLEFLMPPETRPDAQRVEEFRYRLDSSIFEGFRVSEHVRRDGSRFWNQQSFAVIRGGADDSQTKVVITCRDVSDQVNTERQLRQVQVDLKHAAEHDALTGLANRKKLTEYLNAEPLRRQIAAGELGVLQLDIDKFKHINDTLGHAAGDAMLCHIAQALRAHCGPDDLSCRTGGDEFLQICVGLSTQNALMERAHAMLETIEVPLTWATQMIQAGCSIGASRPLDPSTSGESLIQMADQALYEAKNRGRGQVVFYTERLGRAQRDQIRLARDLRRAVESDQFTVHLQPQLNLPENRIVGCEALLRWDHPERGILLPGDFLSSAERNGLLAEIDYISMNLALDALVDLRKAGFSDFKLAINVSSAILADVNYPGLLNWGLQSRQIPPSDICVEILETTILDRDGLDVMAAIDRLKRLGVRVALDDFGTGYAGLSHMSAFDIDAIKLDRSMISRLEGETRNRAVVRAIIRLSHLLGMEVVAEGVETQNQLDMLRRTACPLIQGFGLARPMPTEDLIRWLNANTPLDNDLPFGVDPPNG